MVRNLFVVALMSMFAIGAAAAKTDEERVAATVANAEAVIAAYGTASEQGILVGADGQIERAWRDITKIFGANHPLVPQLAMMRARSATARADRRRIVPAWDMALQLNAPLVSPDQLMTLNIDAGNAAAVAGDADAVTRFFAAARAYAFTRGEWAEATRLQLRVQEIQLIAGSMPWRELRDSLHELRAQSEAFSMWSLQRLEAVLSEAEIRLEHQPKNKEKREDLSEMKAEIELIMKGMNGNIPVAYRARVRQLYYALEDELQL